MRHTLNSPRQNLNAAVHSTATVGSAFLLTGVVPSIGLLFFHRRQGVFEQIFAFTITVMLIGPGVWYIVASRFMRKLQIWPIQVCFRVAAAQAIIVGASLLIQLIGSTPFLFVPAVLAIFFFPALFALVFELRRARAAILVLQPQGRAFQPINVHEAVPFVPLVPPAIIEPINEPDAKPQTNENS